MTSVQQFFAIILGIALLAYVIVVIMGTLQGSTIIPKTSRYIANESGFFNASGYTLTNSTVVGFSSPIIVLALNGSDGQVINAANYTVSDLGIVTNTTIGSAYPKVNFTYSYLYDGQIRNNANVVLGNTSAGISGFFSAINPVYAILAILVIILVLVVLVRVVTGSGEGMQRRYEPQL